MKLIEKIRNKWIIFKYKRYYSNEDILEQAQYLSELQDNWDDEGAKQFDINLIETVISFLNRTHLALFSVYKFKLKRPSLGPCSDGSIDIFWENNGNKLLISVKDVNKVNFYGICNDNDIKGFIKINEVQIWLLIWIKDNLK